MKNIEYLHNLIKINHKYVITRQLNTLKFYQNYFQKLINQSQQHNFIIKYKRFLLIFI